MHFVVKFLKLVNSPRFSFAQVTLMIASFGFLMGFASEITNLDNLDKPVYADVAFVHAEPIPESSHDFCQSDTVESYLEVPPAAPTLAEYRDRILAEDIAEDSEADLVIETEPEALVNIDANIPAATSAVADANVDVDTDADANANADTGTESESESESKANTANADANADTGTDAALPETDPKPAVDFDEQLMWVKNHIYLYFTEEEIREVTLVIQAEDEISQSDTEWAAHAWVILTRLNHPGFENNGTIHGILTAPGQFSAYKKAMRLKPNPDIGRVVVDVMARYVLEQSGFDSEKAGRVIPATHLYWNGNSTGTHNLFYASSSHQGEPYEPIEDASNTPYDT